jgi:hypothetical protein
VAALPELPCHRIQAAEQEELTGKSVLFHRSGARLVEIDRRSRSQARAGTLSIRSSAMQSASSSEASLSSVAASSGTATPPGSSPERPGPLTSRTGVFGNPQSGNAGNFKSFPVRALPATSTQCHSCPSPVCGNGSEMRPNFPVIRQPDPAIHKDERDKRDNAGDRKNKKTAARDTNRASGESGESLLKHFSTTMHTMHRICGIHRGDRIHRDEQNGREGGVGVPASRRGGLSSPAPPERGTPCPASGRGRVFSPPGMAGLEGA